MKLHQIIALVSGRKTEVHKELTAVHHGWVADRLNGICRRYQPKDEDGDALPSEAKPVQLRVDRTLGALRPKLVRFWDLVAAQEQGNTLAWADVIIDGKTLLTKVPVGLLLFLEKQCIDLLSLAENLPTLPTDRVWAYDEARGCYASRPERTTRTQKRPQVIVKYEATPEHPAQTELVPVDQIVGTWETFHLSGAIPVDERTALIERVRKLRDAVKVAREEANGLDTVELPVGEKIMQYLFDNQ